MNKESNSSMPVLNESRLENSMRSLHFVLLFMGSMLNILLVKVLVTSRRRKCTTSLLLTLMSLCDCIYCSVNLSIKLTIDQYINIINHQILCPLSFFLIPFTFTGSTLLLLICLSHLSNNYIRKYHTTTGQLCGPLSAVFVLAFVLIRSVLGTTSVELLVIDQKIPNLQYCTIDMNTSAIVDVMQDIVHVFADVTDLFIYFLWIVIVIKYSIRIIRLKIFRIRRGNERISVIAKNRSWPKRRIVITSNGDDLNEEQETTATSTPMTMRPALIKNTALNRYRHTSMSFIIVSIALCSIILYFPIMIGKYSTLYLIYYEKPLFNAAQTNMLLTLQNTAHSLCLSLRFLPHLLVSHRIRAFICRTSDITSSNFNESSL